MRPYKRYDLKGGDNIVLMLIASELLKDINNNYPIPPWAHVRIFKSEEGQKHQVVFEVDLSQSDADTLAEAFRQIATGRGEWG